jgi:hypothetical protein
MGFPDVFVFTASFLTRNHYVTLIYIGDPSYPAPDRRYRFVITCGHRCPPLRYTTAMLLNRLRLLDTCCVSIACEMQDTDYRSGSKDPYSKTVLSAVAQFCSLGRPTPRQCHLAAWYTRLSVASCLRQRPIDSAQGCVLCCIPAQLQETGC